MRVLKFLLQKEFRQIFRDKTILAMMFVLPVIQLVLIPMVMNFEVKEIKLAIVDNDHSTYSKKMISKIVSSGYFKLTDYVRSYSEAGHLLNMGEADVILEIPLNFEKQLVVDKNQELGVFVDAINGTKSGLGVAYLNTVIQDFNSNIQLSLPNSVRQNRKHIEVKSSVWYNSSANYYWFSVPGVLVLLMTLIGGFLTSLNIVSEKENGTIEQINVSPIKKWQFMLGKLIPFWVVGMVVLSIGLLIANLFYGIVPQGNLLVLCGLAAIYLIALLGFGLLISTISNNQLQSMFIAYFFIMIFIMMSVFFTSVESMPSWARGIAKFIPITHFMSAMRMIVVKGSGFWDLRWAFVYEFAFAIVLNALAVLNYKKTNV